MRSLFRSNTLVAFGLVFSLVLAVLLGVTTNERTLSAAAIGTAAAAVVVVIELLRQIRAEQHRRDCYATLIGFVSGLGDEDERRSAADFLADLIPVMRRMTSLSDRDTIVAFLDELGLALSDQRSRDEALDQLANVKATLTSIRDGRLIVQRSPRPGQPAMTELYGLLAGPVLATSGTKDASWWACDVGQEYLEANRRAHRDRHTDIRRVFVLDDDSEEENARLQEAIEANRAAGVRVRTIHRRELEGEGSKHLLINMTIFADGFVHRDINNDSGETVEYFYSTQSTDIVRLSDLFEQLWDRARDL